MQKTAFIFHGTEGYPEENWFPWLKEKIERESNYQVFVPHFPSPPIVPAKLEEWFAVLKEYEQYFDENTVIVGHSLGGVFALKVLEKMNHRIKAACFVGTPVGALPIANYERDSSFSGFDFNWDKINKQAQNFIVFHSDDDPWVGLENGKKLAEHLGTELTFIPNAGHFNQKAGYSKFEELWGILKPLLV